VNYDLDRMKRGAVVGYLKYYPGICLEELRNAKKNK
jgi:hypothetical protein